MDLIIKWFNNLLGLDLLVEALNNGEPIPVQAILNIVYSSVLLIFGILIAYKSLYTILGLFGKSRKYPEAPKDKKYAFIVPARNEELVIGNLIDSIRAMDYPQELVDIMIVADNCDPDDKTAQIAREKGAIVFERHDTEHVTLGFALQYMFREYAKEHDIVESHYAYIRLDADNIVAPNFLTELNNGMQHGGFDEAVCYRNAKNMGDNIVTAMCSMNVYTHAITSLRARSILKCNQEVYGPSGCYRSYVLKDGWNWTGLTEDMDAEADMTAAGYKTGYVEDAVFYEEEPDKVKIFVRQQMRWTRGGLESFAKYSGPLMKSFFKKPSWNKYDMYWQIFPYSLFSFYFTLTYEIISLVLFLIVGEHGFNWWTFGNYVITTLSGIYVGAFFIDLLTIIREWKRFHLSLPKTIFAIFVFPVYQLINLPVSAISAFMHVKWKRIDHHCVANAEDLVAEEEAKSKK